MSLTPINVDHLELEKSGQRGGKPWHLFNVHGTYDNGDALVNVRTFDSLPAGRVAVELQPYTSDDGNSFTAKIPRSGNSNRQSRPGQSGSDRTVRTDSSSEFEADVLKRLERIERLLKLVVTQLPDDETVDLDPYGALKAPNPGPGKNPIDGPTDS